VEWLSELLRTLRNFFKTACVAVVKALEKIRSGMCNAGITRSDRGTVLRAENFKELLLEHCTALHEARGRLAVCG
jgi:hypothetical protein